MAFKPAKQGSSRVHIIEGQARPDHEPNFMDCMIAGGDEWSLGDVTPIKCQSPDEYNQFVEVGSTQAAPERVSQSLNGRLPLNLSSTLLRLARRRCAYDVHINLGECRDPTNNNVFNKKKIYENATSTSYGSDELGAHDGDEAVNETTDISAADMYEVLPLSWQLRASDIVTNPIIDVVICSKPECGDCDDEDDGCEVIYALADSAPGSPGTAPDVIWSIDRGVTLASDEVSTLIDTDRGAALACVDDKLVVISNEDDAIHWKLQSLINAGTAANWNRVVAGVVAAGSLRDIWGVGRAAFLCGDAGYVYYTSNPIAGVTVLDAGVATTQQLNAIHAISTTFAVAVGESGAVVWTQDRNTWTAATAPAAISLQGVWIKDERTWIVVAGTGAIYYTIDQGTNWTQITNLPVTLAALYDVAFSNNSVGYIGGNIAGPVAVTLRTYDGGFSWVESPELVGNFPTAEYVHAIAACKYDANFAVAVGLAEGVAPALDDGFYAVGNDATA
jgi:photosystem II stability/assembly factor-like uncharacterized protein